MQLRHWICFKAIVSKIALTCLLLSPCLVQAKEWKLLDPSEVHSAVAKAPGYRPGISLCWLNAYSIDTDPQGTNIRAAPDRNAPVIAKIPSERAEADTRIGPEFQVIGSADGWLLIRQVIWRGYDKNEKLLFNGLGWIAAGLVGVSAEDALLRSAPRADASAIMELFSAPNADPSWGPSDIIVKRVYRCSGSFVDADLEIPDGQKARGWVAGICSNQVTTCSGGGIHIEEHNGKLVSPNS